MYFALISPDKQTIRFIYAVEPKLLRQEVSACWAQEESFSTKELLAKIDAYKEWHVYEEQPDDSLKYLGQLKDI